MRSLAALLVFTATTACSSAASAPRSAVAVAASPETRSPSEQGFECGGVAWRGTSARLDRRGPAGFPRTRLTLDARDASGRTTEFLVDTGTSCAFLSSRSPAASGARVSSRPFRLVANEGATAFDGREATVPSLTLGGLSASDVAVFLTDRPHDLRSPGNVAGMAWLANLSLSHNAAADAWTISRGGPALAPTSPPPNAIALVAKSFPVVPVVDDAGRSVYALIDTGTPNSLVDRRTRPGRYRVMGPGGTTLLQFVADDVAPWTGLSPRGKDIAVWIGLEDMARASFTIDFAGGWWVFGSPAAPVAAAPPAPESR